MRKESNKANVNSTTRNRKASIVVILLAGYCLLATALIGAQSRKVKKMVEPKYPSMALKLRVEGTVKLQAMVDRDGMVKNVIVVSGHALLKPAAVESVKGWQYEPSDNLSLIPIEVNFKLPN